MLAFVNTANVLMTASLAVNPVISAVEARQSENPRGTNILLISCPMPASMLFALSATVFRRVSNDCKNHIAIVAKKITVNALSMKSFALSHISRATVFVDGKR